MKYKYETPHAEEVRRAPRANAKDIAAIGN
jgi:hypothetical protein